jgi:hypothetical protein
VVTLIDSARKGLAPPRPEQRNVESDWLKLPSVPPTSTPSLVMTRLRTLAVTPAVSPATDFSFDFQDLLLKPERR